MQALRFILGQAVIILGWIMGTSILYAVVLKVWPGEDLIDGRWEVQAIRWTWSAVLPLSCYVFFKGFVRRVSEKRQRDEQERIALLEAQREALRSRQPSGIGHPGPS